MIKKVDLRTLRVKGFRGYEKEYEFNFINGKNIVEGDNEKRKSTIAFAIAWVFTGYNFYGDKQNLGIVNDYSKNANVFLEFVDEKGDVRTIERRETPSSRTIKFDGERISQTDLEKHIDSGAFLLIFSPLVFLKMKPMEMRETFKRYSDDDYSYLDILKELSPKFADLITEDVADNGIDTSESFVKKRVDFIKTHSKKLEDDIVDLKSKQGIYQEEIKDNSTKLSEIVIDENEKTKLSEKIKKSEEKLQALKKDVPKMDKEKMKSFDKKKNELKKLKEDIKTLKDDKVSLEKDINSLNKKLEDEKSINIKDKVEVDTVKLNQVSLKIKELTAKYNETEDLLEAFDEITSIVSKEDNPKLKLALLKIEDIYNENKNKLSDIKKEGTSLRDKETALKAELAEKKKNLQTKKDESIKKIESELEDKASKLKNLVEKINNFNQEDIVTLENFIKNNNINDYIDSFDKKKEKYIEDNISPIETIIEDTKKSLKIIVDAEEQKTKLSKEIKEKEVKLKDIKEALNDKEDILKKYSFLLEAYKKYQITQSNLSGKSFEKLFRDVSIKFEKVIRSTAEIKPTLEILYQNKDLSKASTSGEIKTGLEISKALTELLDVSYPVFVDNKESITDSIAGFNQLIIAKVVDGKELTFNKKVVEPLSLKKVV